MSMIAERPWLTTLRILVDRSRDGIDLPTAWRILEIMQEHGQSLILDWGEDDDLWECSWISGGERYGGRHKSLQVAVWFAARDVLAPERRPRGRGRAGGRLGAGQAGGGRAGVLPPEGGDH